jgi:hypothetical protein
MLEIACHRVHPLAWIVPVLSGLVRDRFFAGGPIPTASSDDSMNSGEVGQGWRPDASAPGAYLPSSLLKPDGSQAFMMTI